MAVRKTLLADEEVSRLRQNLLKWAMGASWLAAGALTLPAAG